MSACCAAAPAVPEPALEESAPIVCDSNKDIVIAGRFIHTGGIAVQTRGNCNLKIIDSHILTEDVALDIASNSDVEIVRSFVQGRRASLAVRGNADVQIQFSTLRGPIQEEGLGDVVDLEGNRFETVPPISNEVFESSESLRCRAGDRLTWARLFVETDGVGATVEDGCELLLTDSVLRAGETAIEVHPGGSLKVRNSTVESPGEALRVASGGIAHLAGANIDGELSGPGSVVDGGGNAFGRSRPPHRAAHAEIEDPSRDRREGSVRVGRRGIEIRGGSETDGGHIKIGKAGIEIRGSHAGIDPSVDSCTDLCRLWPAITTQQAVCVASVVDSLGFPVGETAVCVDVETQRGCLACTATLDLSDRACRRAAERCLGANR